MWRKWSSSGSVAASSAAKAESSSAARRLFVRPCRSIRSQASWPMSVSPSQMASTPGSGADFDGRLPRGVTKIKTMSARLSRRHPD